MITNEIVPTYQMWFKRNLFISDQWNQRKEAREYKSESNKENDNNRNVYKISFFYRFYLYGILYNKMSAKCVIDILLQWSL